MGKFGISVLGIQFENECTLSIFYSSSAEEFKWGFKRRDRVYTLRLESWGHVCYILPFKWNRNFINHVLFRISYIQWMSNSFVSESSMDALKLVVMRFINR